MNLGRYRLLTQMGVDLDGIRYRAMDPDGDREVEVQLLSGARLDERRWPSLKRRLRLAAQLDHSSARRVLELGLDHDPAYAVLEPGGGKCLATELAGTVPLALGDGLAIGVELAEVLAAAHRLGLAHGHLRPTTIRRRVDSTLLLDFTSLGPIGIPTGVAEIEVACRPPEQPRGTADDCPADVFALAALLVWLLTGKTVRGGSASENALLPLDTLPVTISSQLEPLLLKMLATDPGERARLATIVEPLTRLKKATETGAALAVTSAIAVEAEPVARERAPSTIKQRGRLGRFRIVELLGQGGMGEVYRGEDPADGTTVAIKVLRADWANKENSLTRFHKEARLLAEVNNPFVTNLLEVNEDEGIHYLVLEFVAGRSLAKLLAERGKLDEPTAVGVMADVARALVEAHERGIVHRDIKPDNILLEDASPRASEASPGGHFKVKLSDFGLARHVDQTESLNVTQTGAILGTPLYMSPEQCNQAKVAPHSDVYSMGATLFHLLAGRPPFVGDTPLNIILAHASEPPPSLRKLNPSLSEAVCNIVEKSLAKSPDARYANSGALLVDLERLLRGEPTAIAIHPHLPPHDPKKVMEYDFTFQLDASPAELWPHVSNTERFNRAIGLSAVEFKSEHDPVGGLRRFGKIRKAGLTMAWREHPFEWIEGRRMGVFREFSKGPFEWFVSVVEMLPRREGGTTLTHRLRLLPRGLIGRTVAAVEVGIRSRRSIERVYRHIDAAITGKLGSAAWVDPFEDPASVHGARRKRLDTLLEKLIERRVDDDVAEKLGDFLANAPAQEVARIRPLALARRFALAPDAVVTACLHGAREGLLVLLWDILCPVCRIPSQVQDTLRQLRSHGHCEACNLDFELDFANSVEVIFRAHPEIRDAELGVYCIGGPAHSPHVVAQTRLAPSERIELDLTLAEGAYRLRGPQLPYTLDFRVEANAPARRWDMLLSRGLDAQQARSLRTGGQVLALTNDFRQETVVRIERAAPRGDALTAARAASLALFRELFPSEVLAPGRLVSIATVTLLVTNVEGAEGLYAELGDARAFGLIHEHLQQLDACIRREGGAVVKAQGEGVLAAFNESVSAVRAALSLPRTVPVGGRNLRVRAGVHRGPAMVATLNDHLDYFGTTVQTAGRLPDLIQGGQLALGGAVATDPQVAALLQMRGLAADVLPQGIPERPTEIIHRVRLGEPGAAGIA
jgi:serine/threonine protein kinase/class 3 adenylate cyclase